MVHDCYCCRPSEPAGSEPKRPKRVEQVMQNPLTTFSSSSVGTTDSSSYRGSFHDTPPSENIPKAPPCTATIEAPLVKNRHRNTHTDGHKRVDSSPPSVSLFLCVWIFSACVANLRHLLVKPPPPGRDARKPKSHCAMRFSLLSFFSPFFIYDTSTSMHFATLLAT